MSVFFRADASAAIGIGHIARCLALAGALKAKGMQSIFLAREVPAALADRIAYEGHKLERLVCGSKWHEDACACSAILSQSSGDALVVDHYGLGIEWEGALRSHSTCLLAIDDAPRPHDCDLLLDQNLGADESAYRRLAPGSSLLLGPAYALLRQEFAAARSIARPRHRLRNLLVGFGGSDPTDESAKAYGVLRSFRDFRVEIVLGPAYGGTLTPGHTDVENISIVTNPDNLARRMAAADLALGAGGVSCWERSCVGLPALCITVAANQESIAANCHEAGILKYLGRSAEVLPEQLAKTIDDFRHNDALLKRMSLRAFELTDGGGSARVAQALTTAAHSRSVRS